MSFITRLIKSIFLLFLLLVTAPTLLFLIKWYYGNIVTKKTYVGIIEIPRIIEKSENIISSAKTLFSSSDIRGVVLKCNSNGGNEGACLAIYYDLIKLKELYNKPLIAYIENNCFYGGYLIASSADQIIASPGSQIGYFGKFLKDKIDESDDILNINKTSVQNDEFEKQYYDLLKNNRKNIKEDDLKEYKNSFLIGRIANQKGFVDSIGGNMEVNKILRNKTVIEGRIEEIHGSVIDHLIMYSVDLVKKITKNFK